MGVLYPQKGRREQILEDASREKQEGIQGQWQQESPFREILEQARRNEDTSQKGTPDGKTSKKKAG